MLTLLPYNPGVLPNKPAPTLGDSIQFEVSGLPPIKDIRLSIRNKKHKFHHRFITLRNSAIKAMNGRAWVSSEVEILLTIRSPKEMSIHSRSEYLGGIMDALDGGSGFTFTYLPIVFEDDSQVSSCSIDWKKSLEASYLIQIVFK